MKDKGFISNYGIFSSIVVTVIGVGIFSYPRQITSKINNDGWIVTFIGGFITFILMLLIFKVVKDNEYNSFYTILKDNLGVFLSTIFALIFIAYSIFMLSIGMRVFIEVVKMYLLQRTPTEFLVVITILAGIYIVREEVSVLVKFNEISFWIMFVPVIFILLFTLNNADFTNLLPVGQNKPIEYLYSLNNAIYSFEGFEILYLLLPYSCNKGKIKKSISRSIIFISLFYVLIVVFVIAIFAREQTKTLIWPTITMIKSVDIPGSFIERWEGIVMAMWILFYFTTFINLFYFSCDVTKELFRFNDIKLSSAFLAPIIYIISLYPQNISEIYVLSDKLVPPFFLAIFVVLPLLLIITNKVRKKRGEKISKELL